MKKIITVALLILMCCAPLCACSTDFSAQIDEKMDGLYETLYNALELFFKQTGVPDDSDSDKGTAEGENPSVSGDNVSGNSQENSQDNTGENNEPTIDNNEANSDNSQSEEGVKNEE